ncbi:FIG022708: hypothetical protein [hydrothermal vent metagenome]|uniref:Calcineurin-like phosphoesterase domain-containing protein n=1 Tax=hydrothermal vent metagenome TaxID=652676 RepID=A0A1W1BRW2_9ZZZZ
MYHSDIKLQEGAIFITDAHYNKPKGEVSLFELLQKINSNEIKTPQLLLLGDIFDALFGGVPYTAQANQELIDLIEEIAKTKEVIYLEGNHDFRLTRFFSKNITIYPISKQPMMIQGNGKSICLAHGDFDAPFGYRLYTALIRNPLILFFLNIYDSLTNHSILNFVEHHMEKKEQCGKFEWFEEFIKKRFLNGCRCDLFIEGHFHQNKSLSLKGCRYINLAAFACNQRYFVVKFVQDEVIFQEQMLK